MREIIGKTMRRPGRKWKTAFRLRRRERNAGRILQGSTKSIKKENAICEPSIHDVAVLQRIVETIKGRFYVTFDQKGKVEAEPEAEENVNGGLGRQWKSMATAINVNGVHCRPLTSIAVHCSRH